MEGITSLGRLHPGHLHCLGGGSSPLGSCCCTCVAPSFFDHFLIQPRWKTVQQVLQDQTLLFLATSLTQMGHSYTPFVMSSWVRVAMSAAEDLEKRRC